MKNAHTETEMLPPLPREYYTQPMRNPFDKARLVHRIPFCPEMGRLKLRVPQAVVWRTHHLAAAPTSTG